MKKKSFKLILFLSFLVLPLIFLLLFIYFIIKNNSFYEEEIQKTINTIYNTTEQQFKSALEDHFDILSFLIEPAGMIIRGVNEAKYHKQLKSKMEELSTKMFMIQSKSDFFSELLLVNKQGSELIRYKGYVKLEKKKLKNITATTYFREIKKLNRNSQGIITIHSDKGIQIYIYNHIENLNFNDSFILLGKIKRSKIQFLLSSMYENYETSLSSNKATVNQCIIIYDKSKQYIIAKVPEEFNNNKQKFISKTYNMPITGWNLKIEIPYKYPSLIFYQYKSLFIYLFLSVFLVVFITVMILYNFLASDIKLLTNSILKLSKGEKHINFDLLKSREFYTIASMYNDLIKKLTGQAQLAAIGKSTAMVAHDVRKPLSSMKALLNIIPHIKDDPDKIRQAMTDVDTKISNTNEMLSEILDFSKDATVLKLKKHNPQSIITSSLSDALRTKKDINIKIEYELKHKNYLNVDSNRIIRVFTNIICNAIEAMGGNGKLWFKSNDQVIDDKQQIVITIGDDGPIIPEDAQKKLFDPFFTQGKKGGTGLGLAICQKMVKMHEGDIYIVSNKENKTEFIITLPSVIGNLEAKEDELIYSSDELLQFRKEETERIEYGDTSNTTEFLRIHKEKGKEFYLLVLDDDSLFSETIKTLLHSIHQVRDHVKIIETDNAESALKLFEEQQIDYVIADIDLGKENMNGYEFSKNILDKYPGTYIVINSNKRREEMDEDIREIASPYFMGFLPKPMKQSELLQFLACKTFEIESSDKNVSKQKDEVKKETVLILNDDEIILLSLAMSLKKYKLNILKTKSVEQARKAYESNEINFIFSDINLGEGKPDGYDFVKWVRKQNKKIPIYMISGYSEIMERPIAFKKGATGYYQLPIEENQIEEIIKSCQGAVGRGQKRNNIVGTGLSPARSDNSDFDNIDEILKKVVHDINNSSAKLVALLQSEKNIDGEQKVSLLETIEEIKTVTEKFNVTKSDFTDDEEMYQTLRKAVHDINNPLATLSFIMRGFDEDEVKNKSLMISCLKAMGDAVRTLPKKD